VYQKREDTIWYPLFFCPPGGKGLEDINAARVSAAGDGLTEVNLYFRQGRK